MVRPPEHIWNFDDCTLAISDGTDSKFPTWYWVHKDDDFNHRSPYTTQAKTFPDFLRVKLSLGTNAGGGSAPYFLTVTGCTKRELTDPITILRIPGLCAGGGVDVRAQEIGCVDLSQYTFHNVEQ